MKNQKSLPITVLLVDDNEMVRHSLSLFIKFHQDFRLVGEAANGLEAVDLCVTRKPDVILMDINMPVINGIVATKVIRQISPATCILALTSLEDNGKIDQVLEAGANAFLFKTASIDEIAQSIRNICSPNGNNFEASI